jgi:hypothetical protein
MKAKSKRKLYFRFIKKLTKIKYKKPAFIYMDERFKDGSLVLSNHEGTDSPMTAEIYLNRAIAFWGAGEMNSGLKRLYKYHTRVYYHEKKHWNIHLARLFCLVASPLTNLFYKGLNLISVFPGAQFLTTVRQSFEKLQSGDTLILYPEDSTDGYLTQLKGFHEGFVTLCDYALKKGNDLPVLPAYYRKEDKVYFFGKAYKYSYLKETYKTKEEICKFMCDKCNALYHVKLDQSIIDKARQLDDGLVLNSTDLSVIE